MLDGSVAADVADAEAAIIRLNLEARALSNSEALARLLLRSESVASSRIEGLEIGARRLLDAMVYAVGGVAEGGLISRDHLVEAHRRLLLGSSPPGHPGRTRTEQNWIGGSSFNPCSAVFVPPPWELVDDLLADLVEFCNGDSLPAIAQAAIAHAQFETIHPFVDGNGRIGRVLVHMVLRRRGIAPRVLPPVSLVLATWAEEYVASLGATRYLGPAESGEAHEGVNRWVAVFAAACRRAVADAGMFEERVSAVQESWRSRLGRVRGNSALDLLVDALPAAPILTVQGAAALIGRSVPAANGAVARMVAANILSQSTVGRRNRAFEASELIQAFTDLERQLASPSGDTRSERPARPVPRRASAGP